MVFSQSSYPQVNIVYVLVKVLHLRCNLGVFGDLWKNWLTLKETNRIEDKESVISAVYDPSDGLLVFYFQSPG